MTMQPARFAVQRGKPAGDFQIEHFMDKADTRTHVERINPLEGRSFGAVPGAQRGFQPQPVQTYTTNDIPIAAQFPAR